VLVTPPEALTHQPDMTGRGLLMTLPDEQWRPVAGYEGLYEVSDLGRVRSLPRKGTSGGVLRPHLGNRGYLTVNPCRDGRNRALPVHHLVTRAFLGQLPEGMQVRHLDGDPTNPRLSNLAYGTRRENQLDSVRHGTHSRTVRTNCPQGHLYTEANIRRIPSRPNARYCRECERDRGKGPGPKE
jgi:hypothetical protein